MISDLDIYRSASVIMERYGKDTPTVPGPKSVT